MIFPEKFPSTCQNPSKRKPATVLDAILVSRKKGMDSNNKKFWGSAACGMRTPNNHSMRHAHDFVSAHAEFTVYLDGFILLIGNNFFVNTDSIHFWCLWLGCCSGGRTTRLSIVFFNAIVTRRRIVFCYIIVPLHVFVSCSM